MGLKDSASPFAAMVMVEWGEVGMVTLAKAALNTGMSSFVYIVYYNSLGVILLFPLLIYRIYRKKQPPLTRKLLFRFFLLGLFGRGFLTVGYLGLKYSSPALAASLSNLVPAFTFLLTIIFRTEKIDLRSSSSIAKSLGTLVAISGALIVTLYKGPAILSGTSSSSLHSQALVLQRPPHWALGGLLLAISYCSMAAFYILQAATVKQYPDKVTIIFFFMLFGTLQCATVSSYMERNISAWSLPSGIAMISVLYSGSFGIVFRYNVITWCLHEKGPLYVAMFKPLGMVIAIVAAIVFLGDTLYLGSIIGAVIIAIGFYTVTWGQSRGSKDMAADLLESSNYQHKLDRD